MTARSDNHTGVPEVSKVEFEEKSNLNLSLCEDLMNIGSDCNGIVHESAEEIDGESKDDVDDSYVFVDGADMVSDDPVERDLDIECLVDPSEAAEGEPVVEDKTVMEFDVGSQSKEKQDYNQELRVLEGENSESCNKENLVSFQKHDVTAEGSKCQKNEDEVEKSDTIEEQTKSEDIFMEHSNSESAAVVEENQESPATGTEAIGFYPHQDSANVITEAVESELHQLDNRERKVKQQTRLAESVDSESQLKILESSKDQSKQDSFARLEEDQHSQFTATEIVESELDDLDNVDNEMIKVGDVIPVEESSGHLETEQELNLEMASCPTVDSQLELGATNGTDDSKECVATCPVEQTISETEVINNSAEGHESLSMCNINKFEKESKNVNESIENTESYTCPDDDLKLELDVGDTLTGSGKSLPTGPFTSLQSEVGNLSVERKSTSVDLEAKIGNGSMESDHAIPIVEDTISADAMKLDSMVSNGSVASSGSMPGCTNDVLDVANEGDRSISRGSNGKPVGEEVEGIEVIDDNGSQPFTPEYSATAALERQKVDEEVGKRPFHFLIRIPRYVDDKIRDQIRLALLQVDEKTRSRDAIRVEIQSERTLCSEYHENFEAARSEERAARDALNTKHQEMDSIQSLINRMKNATSVEDLAERIHSMEHRIEHETMPLKEEKQLIREIKQLKHLRQQLCSSLGRWSEIQQPTVDQRDRAEERCKLLKQDLDSARNEVLRTEGITKAARKIYFDKNDKLKELQSQFRAADDLRQEAYTHLQNLKKQLYDKNKYFRMYKEELQKAEDYASVGDKEGLEQLCVNQVNTIMELWNKNDEFRNEYIRCNTMSTLRRLRTLDGRSLGPDEEPPLLHNVVNERIDNTLVALAQGKSVLPLGSEKEDVKFVVNGDQKNPKTDVKSVLNLEKKNPIAKSEKASKPAALENGLVSVSGREESKEKIEENKQTKEEEELARKVEELRKEEAAAKLKEQRRLEEKIKAKEAEERKRRNAEKAKARADLRAQKEAELKEKEREKRARKKEKKVAAAAASGGIKVESVSNSEITLPAATQEPEIKEKASAAVMRPQKPLLLTKQTKTKAIPPLRNKNKRRMQPWLWILLAVLVVVVLFLVGNSGYSSKFGLSSFGF